MRAFVVLIATGAIAVLLGVASAFAGTPTNLRTDIVSLYQAGCGRSQCFISGSATAAFPVIGKADVAYDFRMDTGLGDPSEPVPPSTRFLATFTTPSGGTLTIRGYEPTESAVTGAWTVDSGTGRFARMHGGGTYAWTANIVGDDPSRWTMTLNLTGTLLPHVD